MRSHLFRRCSVAACLFAFVFGGGDGGALAGPLEKSRIAPDAQWLAHFDVEAIVNSQLMQFAIKDGESIDVDFDDLEEMRQEIGLDPFKDIKDIDVLRFATEEEGELNRITLKGKYESRPLKVNMLEAPPPQKDEGKTP